MGDATKDVGNIIGPRQCVLTAVVASQKTDTDCSPVQIMAHVKLKLHQQQSLHAKLQVGDMLCWCPARALTDACQPDTRSANSLLLIARDCY